MQRHINRGAGRDISFYITSDIINDLFKFPTNKQLPIAFIWALTTIQIEKNITRVLSDDWKFVKHLHLGVHHIVVHHVNLVQIDILLTHALRREYIVPKIW